MMKTGIAILRLYLIHISAFLAVGLSTYYPPWDIVAAILYILIIAVEARNIRMNPASSKKIIIIAWQGPGIILSLLAMSHITMWDLQNYAYFIMLFWYTPLVPFLSLLPGLFWRGWPLYYYCLLSLPFLMAAYQYAFSHTPDRSHIYKQ
jgi:hypothetical protein